MVSVMDEHGDHHDYCTDGDGLDGLCVKLGIQQLDCFLLSFRHRNPLQNFYH